jgi:hypothetical protein
VGVVSLLVTTPCAMHVMAWLERAFWYSSYCMVDDLTIRRTPAEVSMWYHVLSCDNACHNYNSSVDSDECSDNTISDSAKLNINDEKKDFSCADSVY